MIAGWRSWAGEAKPPGNALAGAISRYAEAPRRVVGERSLLVAAKGAALGKSGAVSAALLGWIDNAAEIAAELGLARPSPGALYAGALAKWGADADRRLIGNYAAIAHLPGGALHLARTPWDAPPLYYRHLDEHVVASPLLRALFAAGTPRELDYDRVADELAYDWRSGDEHAWYRGVWMVPLGANVRVEGGRRHVDRWHAPPTPRSMASYREAEAVEECRALLDEAAAKALAWSARPALALSGGLDSPLVASALLKALAPDKRLTALTFAPDRDWDGETARGMMGDETPLVRQFVAENPRIDWHIAGNAVGGFDRRARDMFAAMELFAPGLANVDMYHDIYGKARELGCDSLLVADFGNSTFSDSGRYAYCEYAGAGRWRQLLRLLRNRPGDTRPLWRKLLALSILPRLPAPARAVLRSLVHPARADMVALLTPLSEQARSAQRSRADARRTRSAWEDFTYDRSRSEAVAREWADADGPGKDVDLAFEQLYTVRRRDVAAYRPLVEFCMSLPARAFAWDGVERRLARLMGVGRIPDALRTNRRHGQHNIDWHTRMSRERASMRACLEAARDHPWLGEVLDIDRLTGLIDDWPEAPTFDIEQDWPRKLALPRAILAARFVGHVEGRNDL